MKYEFLNKVKSPKDVKPMEYRELNKLAEEVRHFMIDSVSKTGGHLASSLGAVEVTLALFKVFDSPKDKIVWDVGHQAYAHKILTGRKSKFHTLRQYKGISGFLKPEESIHDAFAAGHTSTSISAAMGFAKARDIAGRDNDVVAVIGDASIASGMSLEAINSVGHDKTNMTVVVIDNEYSISPSVGAMSNYLSKAVSGKFYTDLKKNTRTIIESIPKIGKHTASIIKHIEEGVRIILSPGMIFEELGFRYFGPIDGHDIELLAGTLNNIKKIEGPKMLHVITKKGRGYKPAENNPTKFHGIGTFDVATGQGVMKKASEKSYSNIFSEQLVKIARNNKKVVAIVAAMIEGTDLSKFKEKYPERFFDVGIAEEHAVTFAAGLAASGKRPIVAIYSTFMQRSLDQIIHDVAMQKLPVIFAMDRAGLVGEDGPTHHGVFDIAFMKMVPNMVVMAPADDVDLQGLLITAFEYNGPSAIRFPRGLAWTHKEMKGIKGIKPGTSRLIKSGTALTIVNLGSPLKDIIKAVDSLPEAKKKKIEIIDARFAKPIDKGAILKSVQKTKKVITVEEGAIEGGFGQSVLSLLNANAINAKCEILGIQDKFIEQGSMEQLRNQCGISHKGILKAINKMI